MEGVQRIVLATPWPESIGEPEEVFVVDSVETRLDRLLDDFVLQAQNAQRPFRAISLRNVGSPGRTRSVTAPVHLVVQALQLLFEVLSVGLPRHTVDTRRGVPFERKVALLQEIDGDVMQQRSEPYTLALSRRSAHGDEPVRRGAPAHCPGRGRLAAVPLGRGPSLTGLRRGQALFVRRYAVHYGLGVMAPNRPSCSPFGPAVKKTVLGAKLALLLTPLPTRRLHSPSMTIACP